MTLPNNQRCYDCLHWAKCYQAFACDPESRLCNYSPSEFSPIKPLGIRGEEYVRLGQDLADWKDWAVKQARKQR